MKNLLAKNINLLSKEILNYTPQLFHIERNKNDKTPKALGSSVLYFSGNNHYLITAKHIFNHQDEWAIGFLINNYFYELDGEKYSSDDTHIDITVIKLTTQLASILLSHYKFLNKEKIDCNHNCIKPSRYLEVGFPITRTKLKKHDKTIRVNPFILLTKIRNENAEHYFVEIPKKRSTFTDNKPIGTLPKLTGISGSGLWYISSFINLDFKLIAIMIEWDNIEKKFTKGTKINIVCKLIENIENVSH